MLTSDARPIAAEPGPNRPSRVHLFIQIPVVMEARSRWYPDVLREENDHLQFRDLDAYEHVWEGHCQALWNCYRNSCHTHAQFVPVGQRIEICGIERHRLAKFEKEHHGRPAPIMRQSQEMADFMD